MLQPLQAILGMMKNYKILTSNWFLAGLTILLINDLLLKGIFGNWLTGKLSDFSGLFVFVLFWTAIFPKRKTIIFWVIGILFVFWKSSYSQTFIDTWNNLGLLNIYRTVDYSDLIALAILPIVYYLYKNIEKAKTFKFSPAYPLIISAFSFMATSYNTNVSTHKDYQFVFPKDTLIDRFNRIDSLNSGYGVKFTANNPDTVEFSIPSTFCFTNFSVTVVVTEINATATTLTLISAEHRCPAGKKDKEELTKEFETKIIDKIKDDL